MSNVLNPIKSKPFRNSSIELLRSVAMLLIVAAHFAYHSDFQFDPSVVTIPRLWWGLLRIGGSFGVDIFVLITGYFLITNKSVTIGFKRLLVLWGQIFFYAIIVIILTFIVGNGFPDKISLLKSFLPVTFPQWWFASTYVVLFLLHPFINKLLNNLDKKSYQKLLIITIVIWSIIPTFTNSSFQANKLLEFFMFYAIAGYIRIYGLNPKFTCKHYFISFLILTLISYSSYVILIVIGTKVPSVASHCEYFMQRREIITLLRAVCLFMTFVNLKVKDNKVINVIAYGTFGVYLLHDSELMRDIIWTKIFNGPAYADSLLLIPYSIGVVLIVFIVCTLFDLIRHYTLEKLFIIIVEKCTDKILYPFRKLANKFKNLVFGKEI